MGIKQSFITDYCTQVKLELNEYNLLSHDFEKLSSYQIKQRFHSQNQTTQYYEHYQTKKVYSLKKINCPQKQSDLLCKSLQILQKNKNQYLCNVLFSSISKNSSLNRLLNKQTEIKIFSEHSDMDLVEFIERKKKNKYHPFAKESKSNEQLQCLSQPFQQSQNELSNNISLSFTSIQISNFFHTITGIMSEISKLYLPIQIVDPQRFLMIQNEGSRIKYDINFQQLLGRNKKQLQSGRYFSSDLWNDEIQSSSFGQMSQIQWVQKYQKNLIFAFGMISLHFLLLQANYDCYNYKSKQFCKSELQNKLQKLGNMLLHQLQSKQMKESVQNISSGSCVSVLQNQQSSQSQYENKCNNSFQFILYETIVAMLHEDKQKRIDLKQLKSRTKLLMAKVREQYTLIKSEQHFVSNIHKAHQMKAQINSISDSSVKSFNKGEDFILRKVNSLQQNTAVTTQFLKLSKNKSMVTNLKGKQQKQQSISQFSDKITKQNKRTKQKIKKYRINQKRQNLNHSKYEEQFSSISNKQNISSNNKKILDFNNSNLKKQNKEQNVIKLQGYRKIKTSEYSFMEGYFQNNIAHGLGKKINKNGEVTQCIFHNNQIIDQVFNTNHSDFVINEIPHWNSGKN